MTKLIRYGMVGGGIDSLFGNVHRAAAKSNNEFKLICGAFSRNRKKSLQLNATLGLEDNRIYNSYQEMIEKEKKLPDDQRMQIVVIVTPNNTHFEIAKLALENGFHIILEKPITSNVAQAKRLLAIADKNNLKCMVCFTYTGFPALEKAQQLIKDNQLGELKFIQSQYYQAWLIEDVQAANKSAQWRIDPAQSGIAGTLADTGSHVFNLIETVSGLNITQVNADLATFVTGRKLDDYAALLLKFHNGAHGLMSVCQTAQGAQNNLQLHLYGDKAALHWDLSKPNELVLCADQNKDIIEVPPDPINKNYLHLQEQLLAKNDVGLAALANLYHHFALDLNTQQHHLAKHYPSLAEGVRNMILIDASVASSKSNQKWLDVEESVLLNHATNNNGFFSVKKGSSNKENNQSKNLSPA